jgi:hypothetical protein
MDNLPAGRRRALAGQDRRGVRLKARRDDCSSPVPKRRRHPALRREGALRRPWKVHALRTVAPAYADHFLVQGAGVTTKARFQILQFRLDNPPFHVKSELWIAGFHSLLLQFRQHRDASLQSLCNMTHRDLPQARAGQADDHRRAIRFERAAGDGGKAPGTGAEAEEGPLPSSLGPAQLNAVACTITASRRPAS